jgi:hypothetical protein
MIMAAVCLAGVWGLVGVANGLLYEGVRARAQDAAQGTSAMAAAYVRQTLEAAGLVLHSMQAQLGEQGVTDEDAFRAYLKGPAATQALRDRIANMKEVDKAAFVSATGEILNFSVVYPPPPINVADRDYFREQMCDAPPERSLSTAVLDRSTGKWTFFLSQRLTGPASRAQLLAQDRSAAPGKAFGLAIVGIKASLFSDFFAQHGLGGAGVVLLVRDDGVVLAGAGVPPAVYGQKLSLDPPALAGFPDGLRSGPYAVASTAVAGFPAKVVVLDGQAADLRDLGPWRVAIFGLGLLVSMTVLLALWSGGGRRTGKNSTEAARIFAS